MTPAIPGVTGGQGAEPVHRRDSLGGASPTSLRLRQMSSAQPLTGVKVSSYSPGPVSCQWLESERGAIGYKWAVFGPGRLLALPTIESKAIQACWQSIDKMMSESENSPAFPHVVPGWYAGLSALLVFMQSLGKCLLNRFLPSKSVFQGQGRTTTTDRLRIKSSDCRSNLGTRLDILEGTFTQDRINI